MELSNDQMNMTNGVTCKMLAWIGPQKPNLETHNVWDFLAYSKIFIDTRQLDRKLGHLKRYPFGHIDSVILYTTR